MIATLEDIPENFYSDVQKAIGYLKEIGCSEIFLFGSLVSGKTSDSSDIDIAVKGIRPADYFSIYGELMLKLSHSVDLVDMDMQPGFSASLERQDSLFRVA